MDTVIGNKYIDEFSDLNIEVSKKLEGVYDVEEIISTFENFYFNRMFIDITSIKDYKDLSNLQKLSMGMNMDRVIILLDKDDIISESKVFLSKLVDMGIYNFTSDKNNLMYLYNNPNSYKDVAYYQNNDVEDTINDNSDNVITSDNLNNKKILGIKNVTESAGSTTLTYLIKKVLSDYYSTMALEINGRELSYFNDKDTLTVSEDEIDTTINKYSSVECFVIDLGKSNKIELCTDVIYLIEPSMIRLNKLMLINPKIFKEFSDKKVVLNKCLFSEKDIANFEAETNLNVYYTISPLNDREDCSKVLLPLLEKLGYVKVITEEVEDNSGKKGIFGLFKR